MATPSAPAPTRIPTPRPRSSGRPAPRRPSTRRALVYLALSIGLLATVLPFLWMLLSSFKKQGELIRQPPTWLPEEPTLENFGRWFGDFHIHTFFGNSLVVAIATVAGNLLFCSMVGYVLAKKDFPGKRLLFSLVMVTLMIPGVVTLIPMFVMVSKMGLVNTQLALILPFVVSPLGVFLMRQFIAGIPDSLLEAARIDGAGELTVFARVVLPLCGPALATLAILTFLASWNNFLWPLVAAQSESNYTLPVALSLFSTGEHATDYGLLIAGSVLVITPILLLFIALQRFFTQSIAASGIK